jgi:hypothetical protein
LRVLHFAKMAFSTSVSTDKNGNLAPAPWSPKCFEVWKVLLNAWLECEGHLPIKELIRRSGCSLPTVATTLDRLQAHEEIERATNRSAGFVGMPRHSLSEILPFIDGLRHSRRFVDSTGGRPDPEGLLRRIRTKISSNKLGGVMIGGIPAARHYLPDFDLNGLPRVDLSLDGEDSIAWLKSLDPALRFARREERSPILVMHTYYRQVRHAGKLSSDPLPWAAPVEVLLDLLDLRLNSQAEDFVRTLRKKAVVHG